MEAQLVQSAPGQLHTSGKYNEPLLAAGMVVVGTDRIQAFAADAPRRAPSPARAAVAAAPPRAPVADSGLDGEALYRQRCAVCHEHPQGNIPPRAIIARRSHADIVHALSRGAMRAQAAGLSEHDIEAVARYLK